MRVHRSFFSPLFRSGRRRVGGLFAPRKPRHRLLRILMALFGLGVLAVLLVFGLAIGVAMLTGGLLYRLWRQRGKPIARTAQALDGEFRVLRKPTLSTGS
jgi:hypothetical protein